MLATVERKPLGQLMLGRGLIGAEGLDFALDQQKRCGHKRLLGEIFVDLGLCSQEQVIESLAQSFDVPFARISPRLADPKVIGLLPREFLQTRRVMPLFLVEGTLTVAVAEPNDVLLAQEIERLSGRRVQIVAAPAEDIEATLHAFLPSDNVFVIDSLADEMSCEGFVPAVAEDDPDPTPRDTTIARLVNSLIANAAHEGASDIHLEPGPRELRLRYRIDGRLVDRPAPPPQIHAALLARLQFMAGPQTSLICGTIDRRAVELRLSILNSALGERIVIQFHYPEREPPNLERLGFTYDNLKQWRRLIRLPAGLLLIAGPGGSGKYTTLRATLGELVAPELNICTLESPIRCVIPGVNQFPATLLFARGFEAVLRQDPDVVMLGEIADADTARLAIQAALDGRLILASVPASDAPAAVASLLHLGMEPYLLSAAFAGALAQRLVRKLCQSCKESYAPSGAERRQLEPLRAEVATLYRPRGCPRCQNTGFSGRIALHELLVPDDAFTDGINRPATLADVRQLSLNTGLQSLRLDGLQKATSGLTTLHEVLRATSYPSLLHRSGACDTVPPRYNQWKGDEQ
jgi:type IV pilus assembly protein PilB